MTWLSWCSVTLPSRDREKTEPSQPPSAGSPNLPPELLASVLLVLVLPLTLSQWLGTWPISFFFSNINGIVLPVNLFFMYLQKQKYREREEKIDLPWVDFSDGHNSYGCSRLKSGTSIQVSSVGGRVQALGHSSSAFQVPQQGSRSETAW